MEELISGDEHPEIFGIFGFQLFGVAAKADSFISALQARPGGSDGINTGKWEPRDFWAARIPGSDWGHIGNDDN